jgi:putative aldouronate transport system permease protein
MSIPRSLTESARLDGAGELRTFWSILLPLSKPMLACIALFTAVAIYNDWTTPLFYNNQDTWITVQLLLKRILVRIENLSTRHLAVLTKSALPAEGIKAATVVIVVAPILVTYPFLQRYFITGSWLGSIKE